MDALDRYLTEVRRNLFASAEEAARLEADLREHFEAAKAGGEEPHRILEGLGRPLEVAAAFNKGREIEQAGFWLRLVAFIGDFGAMVALCLPAMATAAWVASRDLDWASAGESPPLGFFVLILAVGLAVIGILTLYFPLLEARFGRTLGKQLLGIRVVREDGTPISFGQALVRRLSLYFELLVVDALFIPFTDRKQRALDIIAKTLVAREPDRQAPAWAFAVCLLLPLVSLGLLAGLAVLCAPA